MYGQISTVAFVGIEAKPVEVQVRISGGQHVFAIVAAKDRTRTQWLCWHRYEVQAKVVDASA